MDRGAWQTTAYWVAELDTTERLTHTLLLGMRSFAGFPHWARAVISVEQ